MAPKKDKYLVTEKGLEEIKKELKERKERQLLLETQMGEMRDLGDVSENDAFVLAIEDCRINLEAIEKLEAILGNSKVVRSKVKGKVEIGDSIKLKDAKGKIRTITILGENEADPLNGKVSYNSPLGKAILGKKKGDKVELVTPKSKIQFTITELMD